MSTGDAAKNSVKPPPGDMQWYQLHLSTIFLASIVASVPVWLNVKDDPVGKDGKSFVRGWPDRFQIVQVLESTESVTWNFDALGRDIGFVLFHVVMATFAIEYLTRLLTGVNQPWRYKDRQP